MAHGTGAIQSPPDERDIIITSKQLERLAGASVIPASYILPSRPPITDQGVSPFCVAYSCAYEQNEQDQREHGRFFDFNEPAFFWSIGGTINGAVMRNGLDRMLAYGYPEQDATPNPDRHKIDGYFRVAFQDTDDIKRSIIEFGGVLVIMQWFSSWENPIGTDAVLPAPSGSVSGHAVWIIGWDDSGRAIGQQTWGQAWGDNGRFRMPWSYIKQYAWEVWKTADDLTLRKVAKARIRDTGIRIRTGHVLREDYQLNNRSLWGATTSAGIRRHSDRKIVATPWYKAFKFKGFHHGARHGLGAHPRGWAELSINGESRYVARPFVRLVNQ
jgi:hypothetical protein